MTQDNTPPPGEAPPPRPLGAAYWILAAFALLVLGASMAEWLVPPRASDDAYITYRYARNLAEGKGFVYNEGERVLGTTTPLYAMLLAAGALAGAPIPEFSAAVQWASVMAIGLLMLAHFRRVGAPGMGAAIVLFYALDRQTLGQSIGMEAPLYAALLLGAFAALATGRRSAAALLCAGAALARPDGVLAYAALLVGVLGSKDRAKVLEEGRFFGALAASLGLVAVWVALAWGYFGHPLPQSMIAKATQGLDAGRTKFLARVWETLFFGPDGWRVRFLGPLAVAGALDAWRRFPRERPAFAWLGCYLIFFAPAPDYAWYHFPLSAMAAISAGHGLLAAWRLLERRAKNPKLAALLAGALAAACFWRPLAVIGSPVTVEYIRYPGLRVSSFGYDEAGDWLRENAPEGASVGVLEIGLVGWRSERPVVDLIGLVSPEMLDMAGRFPSPVERLLEARPDYYVRARLEPGFDAAEIFGAKFAATYEKAWEAPYWFYSARDAGGRPLARETRVAVFKLKAQAGEGAPAREK